MGAAIARAWRRGLGVAAASAWLAGCEPSEDAGDTDTDPRGETGGVDTALGDTDDTDDGAVDTDDTDTEEDALPSFLTASWSAGWMDAVTVNTSANVGLGRVQVDLRSTGGRSASLYLADIRSAPRSDERHTLLGPGPTEAQEGGVDVVRWTRALDCEASTYQADVRTTYRCGSSFDAFSEGADGQRVAFAVALWASPDPEPWQAPVDCILFGWAPAQLLREEPLAGLMPPAWLTDECRVVGQVGG